MKPCAVPARGMPSSPSPSPLIWLCVATRLSLAFEPDGVGIAASGSRRQTSRRTIVEQKEPATWFFKKSLFFSSTSVSNFCRVQAYAHFCPSYLLLLPPIEDTMAPTSSNGSNGTAVGNGIHHASTSAAPLDASKALAHLSTYEQGDGLSMSELVDSRTNGGLTYNGKS
jgi:hypothetical protein